MSPFPDNCIKKLNIAAAIFACLCSLEGMASSHAKSLQCNLFNNPNKTALVGGQSFQLAIDKDLGLNNEFETIATLSSSFLGFCEGVVKENKNPLAEGPIEVADVTGGNCAADGFALYLGAGCGLNSPCVVQVNEAPEDVYYFCK